MILDDEIIFCTNQIAQLVNPGIGVYYMSVCDLLANMVKCGRCTGVDRTGTLVNRFKFKNLNPIPEIPHTFIKSFKDICFERAREIVNLNNPISVMWSGGIDSTAALTTLMQVTPPGQIKVLFEERSLTEYPQFFENYIKGKFEYELLTKYIYRYKQKHDEILITGQHGDQLFGSAVIINNFELKDILWPELFNHTEIFGIKNLFKKQSIRNYIRDHIQSYLDKSPIEIKTVQDFYWWINFTIKWQAIDLRQSSLQPITKERYSMTRNFFNTPDFQIWSMINHDLKIKNTPESYKYIIKDVIYDFNGDADYRDHKLKEASGKPQASLDQNYNTHDKIVDYVKRGEAPSIVDTNFNNFSYKTILNNLDIFKKISNPLPKAILNQEVLYDDNWINVHSMP